MIDLQAALKLLRRQGAVASQNQHLGRTLGGSPYPVASTGNVAVSTQPTIEVEVWEPPKPEGVEACAGTVSAFSVKLKDTTIYTDYRVPVADTCSGQVTSFSVKIKNTTVLTDYKLPVDACKGDVAVFSVRLSKLPLDHTDRDTVTSTKPTIVAELNNDYK